MKYKSDENYSHGDERKIGILLVNLGTPDAPTTSAVRKYLAEFLADPNCGDSKNNLVANSKFNNFKY